MNIKSRINARKVALSRLYQHCFFRNLLKQKSAMIEALFIDNIFQTQGEKFNAGKEDLLHKMQDYLDKTSTAEDMDVFVEDFFDEWAKEDVDFDYLIKVLKDIPKNQDEVEKHVDTYTTTFKYADMDVIDQALFLLWYMERKQLQTPKEVLLNELIELAKRYCDEGSPKLINGIMHKIVHEVEEK